MYTRSADIGRDRGETRAGGPLPDHPCMNQDAHDRIGRLHLPVAPKCNIHCTYCQRRVTAALDRAQRPGLTSEIITPVQALAKAGGFLSRWGDDAVVGIAGPGDPLANPETLETFELVRAEYPRANLCLCTNGLELGHSIDALHDVGVKFLTVTINSVDAEVVSRIHPRVRIGRRVLRGLRAARLLVRRQLEGAEAAVGRGMHVKINTVLVPGVNEFHVEAVAERVASLGALVFNLMPLIPRGRGDRPPMDCHVKALRARCAEHLPVFDRCKHCRADAEGIPGQAHGTEDTEPIEMNRRRFLKASGLALTGSLAVSAPALAGEFKSQSLQLWSCGGLAEAFIPANKRFELMTGCSVNYTGASAAALGKSLLGSAQTEVFAPRVLELARKLKAQGKMLGFWPLCFTKYVLVTPLGNPAGIAGLADLARPGVRVVLSPGASPPGGKAVLGILKKAGVLEAAHSNAVRSGDCVQRDVADVASGAADAAVVEQRITRLPEMAGRLEVIDIPEDLVPAVPVPFVIGVMKRSKNATLAREFVAFILSAEGQAFFEQAGFIPADSEEGRRLTQKHGVKDE